MSGKGYTVLGWLVWQIGTRVARRKIVQNRVKLGATLAIGVVLIAGAVAGARGLGGDD